MNNAFPIPGLKDDCGFNGLTKREYFAALAMQGILSNSVMGDSILHDSPEEWLKDVSESAVEFADATIAKLSRTETNENARDYLQDASADDSDDQEWLVY